MKNLLQGVFSFALLMGVNALILVNKFNRKFA